MWSASLIPSRAHGQYNIRGFHSLIRPSGTPFVRRFSSLFSSSPRFFFANLLTAPDCGHLKLKKSIHNLRTTVGRRSAIAPPSSICRTLLHRGVLWSSIVASRSHGDPIADVSRRRGTRGRRERLSTQTQQQHQQQQPATGKPAKENARALLCVSTRAVEASACRGGTGRLRRAARKTKMRNSGGKARGRESGRKAFDRRTEGPIKNGNKNENKCLAESRFRCVSGG